MMGEDDRDVGWLTDREEASNVCHVFDNTCEGGLTILFVHASGNKYRFKICRRHLARYLKPDGSPAASFSFAEDPFLVECKKVLTEIQKSG